MLMVLVMLEASKPEPEAVITVVAPVVAESLA